MLVAVLPIGRVRGGAEVKTGGGRYVNWGILDYGE